MLFAGERLECGEKIVIVKNFLGKGKSGYSYLVEFGEQLAVLNKIHHEPCSVYCFGPDKLEVQLRDYHILQALGIPMPRLFAYDLEREFLVKEYIEGPSLAQMLACKEIPFRFFRQMIKICESAYASHWNLDYMPQNFIVHKGYIVYVDYECNPYDWKWDFEHWGIYFWLNQKGMRRFMETGDYGYISVDGWPVKTADIEERVLKMKKRLLSQRKNETGGGNTYEY